MTGIEHDQTSHSPGPTSGTGQKAKYSLRAHIVRFAPDSGLNSDIPACLKRARRRHRRYRASQHKQAMKSPLWLSPHCSRTPAFLSPSSMSSYSRRNCGLLECA